MGAPAPSVQVPHQLRWNNSKYDSSKNHNRWTLMKERSLFIQKFEQIAREDLQEYVEKQLRWYWYWYYVFLSAVARGRLWSAFTQLQQMREYAFKLIVLAHHPQKIPGQRFERTVPRLVRDELGNASLPHYTRSSMIGSADAMTEILRREIKQLLLSSHASYPADLEATILDKKHSIVKSSLNRGSEAS